MPARAKRVNDPRSHADGYRVLVDGIWPRGISRERAAVDHWARELAPSAPLRNWYKALARPLRGVHPPLPRELGDQRDIRELRRRSRSGVVTLVFAARDAEHSNAAVLGDVLRRGLR